MKLCKWLAANVLNIIGGLLIGLGIPIGSNILPFPDFYLFMPIGVLLLGISFYYKFIEKT